VIEAVDRKGNKVPKGTVCRDCGAPEAYLYLNDGKSATQVRCKICSGLSQIVRTRRRNERTVFWCPYCGRALYRWKHQRDCTLYKCGNDACPHYRKRKHALNWKERFLQQLKGSQFKLRYQYRVYHFQPGQPVPAGPGRPTVDLARIHRSSEVLGLVLAFHVSFALSARKTAQVLRSIFGIPISYQTVLNYTQAAAFSCHRFNLRHKAPLAGTQTGDETYLRVGARHHYAFFFLDAKTHQITAYHVAPERDVLGATTALSETVRTLPEDQAARFISDGNPSYRAGLHFLNAARRPDQPRHTLEQVIGLSKLEGVATLQGRWNKILELAMTA
jgi:putative transposase